MVKNNQDNDLNDNKVTNINSITNNNNLTDDNHVSNKKYIDDELDKDTILRINQTLQNYLKVSVGIDIYNLTKYYKIQITDITIMKAGKTGGYLLPYWKIICKDKNKNGKIQILIKSTKTRKWHSESADPAKGLGLSLAKQTDEQTDKPKILSTQRFQLSTLAFLANALTN